MNIMHTIKNPDLVVAASYHKGFDVHYEEKLFQTEKNIIIQLSPRKKSEWIASRELLFMIADLPERTECLYDDFGKPILIGTTKHISVSHSGDWAAAMVSEKPCGVDIQEYSHTVERIAERFLSAGEMEQANKSSDRFRFLHLLWSAKECLYKAYGKKKLEFRSHIAIQSIDAQSCTGVGEIRYEDIHLRYDIYYRLLPEVAWVFCLEHNRTI